MLGTRTDNNRDMARKRRHAAHRGDTSYTSHGEEHYAAKLTEGDVREIRASAASDAELAMRYGVHPATVRSARRRHTWRHVA